MSDDRAHALISASKMARIMRCPGSVALEANIPDTASAYAEEGTRAHALAANLLDDSDTRRFTVDTDMLDNVQVYVDYVRKEAAGHELMVEQRVDYSDVIGVPDSFGTADAIILAGDTLIICDLKYGVGVRVDAEENEQLQMYAIGALDLYGLVHDFKKVKLAIIQPRLNHISEWETTPRDLRAFADEASSAAKRAMHIFTTGESDGWLSPGEKQCQFCKAKATCPALSSFVQESVGADFDNLDADEIKTSPMAMGENSLGAAMQAVALVEDWCKAVRAKAEAELLAGKRVPGFKLVQGRNGARKWANKEEAEATLKKMKLKVEEMYDLELITPPAAEKLAKKGVIGPRQWPALQSLITQKPGPPSVAPESDKRPAWSPADDFDNLETTEN